MFTLMGNLSGGPAGAAVGQNDSENLVSKNSPRLAVALNCGIGSSSLNADESLRIRWVVFLQWPDWRLPRRQME